MSVVLAGTDALTVAIDDDGYLLHLEDWSPAVAV